MIMRLRYIGTELIDHIPFGKVFYVRFKQYNDLTIGIYAVNGEGLSYTDLYHFLTEWKILNIEKGRENERFNKSGRSDGFGTKLNGDVTGASINGMPIHIDHSGTSGNNFWIIPKGI